jgi:hypothetical protein
MPRRSAGTRICLAYFRGGRMKTTFTYQVLLYPHFRKRMQNNIANVTLEEFEGGLRFASVKITLLFSMLQETDIPASWKGDSEC